MAKYAIDETTLQKLADAVRTEANVTDGLSTADMEEKIHRIPDVTIDKLLCQDSPITSIVYTGSFIRINNAFSSMPNLVSATLPNTQNLPQGTFNGCVNLKKVDLGENLYMSETLAFWGCSSLDTLILRRTDHTCLVPSGALVGTPIESGNGYIYVYRSVLSSYEADTNYSDLIQFRAIEDYPEICKREEYGSSGSGGGDNGAVSDSSFKDVIERTATNPTLPSDLTKIGSRAFYYYTNLALTSLPSGVTSIGDYAFQSCSNLALTSLPSGVTSIGNYAFSGCTNLALTSLPDNLTSMLTRAFDGCKKLAFTSLPNNITTIGSYVFYNCTNLALRNLPNNVQWIYGSAFQNCKSLALTSLPSTLRQISSSAFSGCTGLTSITFEGKPTSIASSAFYDCTNLITINVPWAEGEVANAPWGATNATINYNYTGGTA